MKEELQELLPLLEGANENARFLIYAHYGCKLLELFMVFMVLTTLIVLGFKLAKNVGCIK